MGSLVRLPQRQDQTLDNTATLPFYLTIDNSNFVNMSFCGSIISNDYPIFQNQTEYMSAINSAFELEIRRFYSKDPYQSVSSLDPLYSISFTSNTIQGLNLLKTGTKLFEDKVPQNMHKFGLAVHLVRYPGKLELSGNKFTDTKMNLDDVCSVQQLTSSGKTKYYQTVAYDWTQSQNFYKASATPNMLLSSTQNHTFQMHSLILIDQQMVDNSNAINISGNSFENNLISSSLISVQKTSSAS